MTDPSPPSKTPPPDSPPRNVVLGSHSKVWRALAGRQPLKGWAGLTLSHRELEAATLRPQDRVWIFSYSPVAADNRALLDRLAASGAELIYIGSSSSIVARQTRCYAYPTVKEAAQIHAMSLPRSRVVLLGLVVDALDELPAGANVATTLDELADFMAAPRFDGPVTPVWTRRDRPFSGALEATAYAAYGGLMKLAGFWPCLLRPLDLILKALGYRWYGYTFLSNRQWLSTT